MHLTLYAASIPGLSDRICCLPEIVALIAVDVLSELDPSTKSHCSDDYWLRYGLRRLTEEKIE